MSVSTGYVLWKLGKASGLMDRAIAGITELPDRSLTQDAAKTMSAIKAQIQNSQHVIDTLAEKVIAEGISEPELSE